MKSRERMAKKEKKAGNKDDRRLAPALSEKSSEKTAKQPPKAKINSAAERRKNRIDGIIKTVYPSVLGAAAGFACYYAGDALAPYPWHFVMLSLYWSHFLSKKIPTIS